VQKVDIAGIGMVPRETKDPSCPEGSWVVPYRAGEPARNWHLAGASR
jgi:hypothetical protein